MMNFLSLILLICPLLTTSGTTLKPILDKLIGADDDISMEEELLRKHSDVNNLLPPFWDDVKKLDETNFARDPDSGALVVDVWDYLERQALYKWLIENVKHCEWTSNTDINRGNILWGLPLQHGWQFSSGRLLTPPNGTTIDPESWWADMNYYLSVVPYLGAMEVPAVNAPKIMVKKNPDESLFCAESLSCPDTVEPWKQFFELVIKTEDNCNDIENEFKMERTDKSDATTVFAGPLNHTFKTPVANLVEFNLSMGMESLLSSLWAAHIHSIGIALPLFNATLWALPTPERNFGRSWAGIVDFIAGVHFYCDLGTTDVLQNLLPPLVLEEGQHPPFVSDISRLQNRAVAIIDGLFLFNYTTSGQVERIWDYSMCLGERSLAIGRQMLTLGIYRPVLLLEGLESLVAIMQEEVGSAVDRLCRSSLKATDSAALAEYLGKTYAQQSLHAHTQK